MKKNIKKLNTPVNEENSEETNDLSGYPSYAEIEDIYNKYLKEQDINPEDITKTKAPITEEGAANIKDFRDDHSGDDLDVPGSELDDLQENIGSEDEENNYYSLGGDNHSN